MLIISSILIIMVKVLGHDDTPLQVSDSHMAQPSPSYVFVKKWGSAGKEDGQFGGFSVDYGPLYITVDNSDNIYVSDLYNRRIQKFNSEGNFILK